MKELYLYEQNGNNCTDSSGFKHWKKIIFEGHNNTSYFAVFYSIKAFVWISWKSWKCKVYFAVYSHFKTLLYVGVTIIKTDDKECGVDRVTDGKVVISKLSWYMSRFIEWSSLIRSKEKC